MVDRFPDFLVVLIGFPFGQDELVILLGGPVLEDGGKSFRKFFCLIPPFLFFQPALLRILPENVALDSAVHIDLVDRSRDGENLSDNRRNTRAIRDANKGYGQTQTNISSAKSRRRGIRRMYLSGFSPPCFSAVQIIFYSE